MDSLTYAKLRGQCLSLLWLLKLIAILVLIYALVHARNLYPRRYSARQRQQENAEYVWTHVCKQGMDPQTVASPHVNCESSYAVMQASVSALALEDVLATMLGELNPVKYLIPSGTGVLGYVVIRTLDTILSYTMALVGVVFLVLVWYVWSFYAVPYAAVMRHRSLQRYSKMDYVGVPQMELWADSKRV